MAVDPNESFLVKLNGQPLNIILSPKPQATAQPQGLTNRQGQLHTRRRPNDELLSGKKKGFINFYDMGQIKDPDSGLFIETSFYRDGLSDIDTGAVRNFGVTDYAALEGISLAYSIPDWPTTFRRFTDTDGKLYNVKISGDDFVLTLADDEPEWTDAGLNLTADEKASTLLQIGTNDDVTFNPFNEFVLKGSGRNRVTATYDRAGMDIGPISLTGNVNIYLMSRLVNSYGESTQQVPPGGPQNAFILNAFFSLYPRATLLDPMNPLYGTFVYASLFINDGAPASDMGAYTAALVPIEFHKQFQNTRGFFSSGGAFGSAAISGFPLAGTVPPPAGGYSADPFFGVGSNPGFTASGNYLVAVVLKGSTPFYIWSDSA